MRKNLFTPKKKDKNKLKIGNSKRYLSAIGFLASLACFFNHQSFSAEMSAKKEVLFINSYHRGHGWSDEIESGIRETLLAAGEPIELSVVYLDSLRYQAASVREKVADILNIKNVAESTDLIITSDSAALDFALSHQEQLFPKQHILFTAISDLEDYPISNEKKTTGILQFKGFNTAIDLALSIHENTSDIVFIGSTKEPHNERILDIIEKEIAPEFSRKLKVSILSDQSIDQLDQALSKLPRTTLVFAISDTLQKSDGNLYSPVETARILSSITSLPFYSYWHSHIGHGAIGGQIVTGHNQGKAAGQLALQVISSRQGLPSPKAPPASLFFDVDVMKKFGIQKDQLPEGTQFIHDKPAIWQEYQMEVLTTLTLLFGLISVVLGFILLTRRQKQTINKMYDDQSSLSQALELNKEALDEMKQLLKEVNNVDELTGLFNVRYFDEMLDKELRRASRYGTSVSLMIISIDRYQSYVRHHGEEKAQELLIEFSELLTFTCQRSSDVIAYIQDAKFALILPHTNQENALIVGHKVHHQLKEADFPFILSNTGSVTVSIGLSSLEGLSQHINPQHMFNTCEMLRIAAEKEGGNKSKSDCVRLNNEQSLMQNIKSIHIS